MLRRGRVFEKLELELRALRKAQKKDPAEAALFEGSHIEAGPSRNQIWAKKSIKRRTLGVN